MSVGTLLRISAALLWCVTALAAQAQPGTPLQPSPVVQSASSRYLVSVNLQPGDDLDAVSAQLVRTYRGRMEPYAEVGFRGFMIVTTEASARLLGADPRVLSIEPVEESATAAGSAPPVTVSRHHAAADSAQTPRFPRAPVTEVNASWSSGPYAYDGSGNIKSIGTVEKYVYDAFGRLTSGTVASGKVQANTYDDFGNLLTITIDNDTAHTTLIGVNRDTNRASEDFDPQTNAARNAFGSYDAEGNMVSNVVGDTFVYDGLGMVKESTVDGQRRLHLYTPNEERIASVAIRAKDGQDAVAETLWTIRNPGGAVLSRFTSTAAGVWSWDEDYIYRDGQLLAAEVSAPEKVRHFHLDHLGTPRLITGNGGAELSRHTYYPFGREVDPPSSGERAKFTGHERDHPTLDYMHARYYPPMWGRFLSVDPVLGDVSRPQSWNRYAYVQSNPLAYVDPDGRQIDLAYIRDDADRNLLIEQLRARTGLDLAYENGLLVSNGALSDADGNALGSATARAELLDAINSETVFTGRSMNGSNNIDLGASGANTVFMDFTDIGQISLGRNPAGTVNAASIFLHELRHSDGGQNLADPTAVQLRLNRHLTGENVDVDNRINRELGLPTRSRYLDSVDSRGRRHWDFSRGPVYLPTARRR